MTFDPLLCGNRTFAQLLQILSPHHLSKASANPFRNRWGHGVADCMIAEAVDPVGLAFVEVAWPGPIVGETLHPLHFIRCEPADPPVRIPDIVARPVGPGVAG